MNDKCKNSRVENAIGEGYIKHRTHDLIRIGLEIESN